jgi:septum site-determining protein MinC
MTDGTSQFRLVGRSFILFVLMPEPPITGWLDELDAWLQRAPGFFEGKPVLLDLSKQALAKPEIAALIADLKARKIATVALKGVDSSLLDPELPPLINATKRDHMPETCDVVCVDAPTDSLNHLPEPTSLLLDEPVRSGQSIVFTSGDVTVVGSIASGAEVIAGGSIHVYGTLRGRAIAGVSDHADARIFCRKFDAELVAIGGLYTTLNDSGTDLCGRPVQAWLDQDSLQMRALD